MRDPRFQTHIPPIFRGRQPLGQVAGSSQRAHAGAYYCISLEPHLPEEGPPERGSDAHSPVFQGQVPSTTAGHWPPGSLGRAQTNLCAAETTLLSSAVNSLQPWCALPAKWAARGLVERGGQAWQVGLASGFHSHFLPCAPVSANSDWPRPQARRAGGRGARDGSSFEDHMVWGKCTKSVSISYVLAQCGCTGAFCPLSPWPPDQPSDVAGHPTPQTGNRALRRSLDEAMHWPVADLRLERGLQSPSPQHRDPGGRGLSGDHLLNPPLWYIPLPCPQVAFPLPNC